MNETAKTPMTQALADHARIWYPFHPRWIPLFRLFCSVGLQCLLYRVVVQWPLSFAELARMAVPTILLLSGFFIRPELRAPTVLNRLGGIAHLLLLLLAFPLALGALIFHWLRV